jgi:hypothetical protein
MHIFIMTNSPGEVMGWVKPVAEKLKEKQKGAIITVVINNYCGYSSLSICQRDGRQSSRGDSCGGFCGGSISVLEVSFSGQ